MTIAKTFASVVFLLATLPAADACADDDWRTRSQLTGDWCGVRSRLGERGIDPYANYTTGFWANAHGGFDTGIRYEGLATWGLDLDLGKLVAWTGARFHIGWHAYHGGQPSADLVGPFSTTAVSGWEAADSVRFYEIYLEQRAFADRVRIKAGQIAADDDFFVAQNDAALLNATFGFFAFGGDVQMGPFYPVAAPGVFVELKPGAGWIVRAGAYTAVPGDDVRDNIGFDWSFHRGAFGVGEVGVERSPFGLAGRYSVGVIGTSADLTDFETGSDAGGGWSLYAVIDQTLIADSAGASKLGLSVRGDFGAQPDRNALRAYVDAALQLTGPLPGRESDVLAFGAAYVRPSVDYLSSLRDAGQDVTDHQLVFELTYRAQITGWLTLQPDLQLFVDPTFSRRDSVVIGLSAVIEL
jgi:porin